MSLSGMFNIGHDVAGFSGPVPDPELLVRFIQAGALHSRFVMNSWKLDGTVTTPWLHPEALPAIRWGDPSALSTDALSL
jgi:alpha-glucosidase